MSCLSDYFNKWLPLNLSMKTWHNSLQIFSERCWNIFEVALVMSAIESCMTYHSRSGATNTSNSLHSQGCHSEVSCIVSVDMRNGTLRRWTCFLSSERETQCSASNDVPLFCHPNICSDKLFFFPHYFFIQISVTLGQEMLTEIQWLWSHLSRILLS